MTDPTRDLETGDDDGTQYESESTGIPRWVKVVGIVVAIVVLLVVVVMLVGGGHGPRRHGLPGGYREVISAPVWTIHDGGLPWHR